MKKQNNRQVNQSTNSDIQEDIKKLVLARIQATSDDLRIAIGSTEYTKEEMIKSVEKGDEVGKEIIDIQMEYLRDMAQGAAYQLFDD
ncbi:MAG: hypothetical protein UU34_C0012G0009 [Candidatus Curtissbacteria bacterium GW2011_GWA1_41_11]|uniref:Uncharacterized protein n=1 Tax=Candidatus Curtissbacteria bacterium GW2011_GWA1_41_11 TaxID=1618409 RepID=A0A0G0UGP6_9BACT|nr:MAG: hypothetical protein UU34_C0012G0009 [Candidatus Curtissbacteria bacterium GW2011_GWA1_41_11]